MSQLSSWIVTTRNPFYKACHLPHHYMLFIRRNKFLVFAVVVGVCLIGVYRLNTQRGREETLADRQSTIPSYRSFQNGELFRPIAQIGFRSKLIRKNAHQESDPHENKPIEAATDEGENIGKDNELGRQNVDRKPEIEKEEPETRDEDENEAEEELENTLDWVDRLGRGNSRKKASASDSNEHAQTGIAPHVTTNEPMGKEKNDIADHVSRYHPRVDKNVPRERHLSHVSAEITRDVMALSSEKVSTAEGTVVTTTTHDRTHGLTYPATPSSAPSSVPTQHEVISSGRARGMTTSSPEATLERGDQVRTTSVRGMQETKQHRDITSYVGTGRPKGLPDTRTTWTTGGTQTISRTTAENENNQYTEFTSDSSVPPSTTPSVSRVESKSLRSEPEKDELLATTQPSTSSKTLSNNPLLSLTTTETQNRIPATSSQGEIAQHDTFTNGTTYLGGLSYTATPVPSFYSPTPSQSSVYACKLPKINPWDPSIRHLLREVGVDPECRSRYPQPKFKVIDNRFVAEQPEEKFEYVNLKTIHRVDDGRVNLVRATLRLNLTDDNRYVSNRITGSDFLKLSYKTRGKGEERHYFARVVPNEAFIQKSRDIRQGNSASKGLPLNILMLGFDSTSHANFLRKMPHTLDFLRTRLKTYVMDGFSIVGDATTPALTALLTGNFDSKLPEGRRGYLGSGFLDNWPWISKEFESRGYATLYAEDDPSMSTFNLRLNGFNEPPYHHYIRPFWQELEAAGLRDDVGLCSNGVSMVNHTMEYLLSFFRAYNDTPKFALGFVSYIAHAHPNHLSYGDYDVLSMLTRLTQAGYHNNTVIILFGDHGSRNDDVRNTIQGKLEERLPWLSISVPDWLESKYPEIAAALENNKHVISSPFDLHATLRHILTYPDAPKGEKTQSLFTKLNVTRRCEDAMIDEHWCPCLEFTPVQVNNPEVTKVAQAAVQHINRRLNSRELVRKSCHQILLTKVHSAMKYEPNSKVQRFASTNQDSDQHVNFGAKTDDDNHYLITMETDPMKALFEVTVSISQEGHVFVNPNISRTNKYGAQPECIAKQFPYFRKFCVCKESNVHR